MSHIIFIKKINNIEHGIRVEVTITDTFFVLLVHIYVAIWVA